MTSPCDRPRPKGGIYVDLTARRADGSTVRVMLVDTLADGVTPTARETSAAGRIRAAWPRDELRLIPKARTGGASLGPEPHPEIVKNPQGKRLGRLAAAAARWLVGAPDRRPFT